MIEVASYIAAQFRTPEMVVSEAERMVTVCVMFTEPMDITSSGELVILPSLIVGGAMCKPVLYVIAKAQECCMSNKVGSRPHTECFNTHTAHTVHAITNLSCFSTKPCCMTKVVVLHYMLYTMYVCLHLVTDVPF